ncbi:MAG: Ig-like domain-containing protein [Flavitalea sp.]
MKQSFLLFVVVSLFVFTGMIGGSGCANIIAPTGGPRDSLPPIPVSKNPLDSSVNFKGKKITLSFNEYVQLDNIQENLLVSPFPKITPTVESKLRTVTITLRDTAELNTTYSLNFGNAIKDVNEGNPVKNFTYIFSTGPKLDSLTIGGKVINAETGKADSTLIVVLHRNFADSALKERPRYVTKLDNKGAFKFKNLPAEEYAIYAFKDEGGARRYTSPTQLFAFSNETVASANPPKDLVLYAYLEPDTATARPTKKVAPAAKPALKGNAAIADRLLRFQFSAANGPLGLLPSDTLHMTFPQDPLKEFDSTKIRLFNEQFEPITNFRTVLDTSNKKLTFFYPWKENSAYNMIIEKEFATDTSGRQIPRSDTLSFATKKETDYGLVRLRFPTIDLTRNPVLLFVQNDGVVYSYVFGQTKEFRARLFNPGEYELRILYDENKNGKWDPGDFFNTKKQPEKVTPITRKANIRANIDNDIDIEL